MNLLANGHKKDSKAAPEFDFSIHKYFPTIKQNWVVYTLIGEFVSSLDSKLFRNYKPF